ncbi:unc-45 myosin chaperone [Brevipalpus obovatus]|uniref:unc-45 myosin chaperone n=1 Tax=Brevipalpus obovatus TaxID=246614 RepID=UPI003D9DC824
MNEDCPMAKRVIHTMDQLKNGSLPPDKRVNAGNNLLVLAKESAAARYIVERNGIELIHDIIEKERFPELALALIRGLSEICRHEAELAIKVLNCFSVNSLIDLMIDRLTTEEQIVALQYLLQTIINSLTGLDPKTNQPPSEEKLKQFEDQVESVMSTITNRTNSRVLSGSARDSLLELVSRNVGINALYYGYKLLKGGQIFNLLEVAGELEDLHYESSMSITRSTRSLVAITLERLYECLDFDKAREECREKCMGFIREKLRGGDSESRIQSLAIITTLLQGAVEVGNYCISQQGVVEMMLMMAGEDSEEVQQRVAAEAIVAAASKKERCTSIATLGLGILKKLYTSSNEGIRVRALVGLCKIGSVGGGDASIKPFSDDSLHQLAKACKRILTNPKKDQDLKKWAIEGLVYLTLDADIKEELCADMEALKALINVAKTGDMSILYGVLTTLVNLTNSFEKKEIMPELLELAKFAKQHVPEEHPKDTKEFVDERVKKLANSDVTSALVVLSKTESMSSREMICRILNAICEHHELRGRVVQGGGVKVLLQLARGSNTKRGKIIASQALARIGISIDPRIAFPGQRAVEVIKPLMNLLDVECSALENFEALMALTNLAQSDPSVQAAILRDNGFSKLEHYYFEDHTMLKRAATQCVANLITNPEVIKLYEDENDRVKYLLLLSEEEDLDTILAATGALAMLTSASTKCCEKIVTISNWLELMMLLCSSSEPGLQHRGLFIAQNMVLASKELAEKIVDTQLFEVFVAITRPEIDNIEKNIKQIAEKILAKSVEYGLIKPNQDA